MTWEAKVFTLEGREALKTGATLKESDCVRERKKEQISKTAGGQNVWEERLERERGSPSPLFHASSHGMWQFLRWKPFTVLLLLSESQQQPQQQHKRGILRAIRDNNRSNNSTCSSIDKLGKNRAFICDTLLVSEKLNWSLSWKEIMNQNVDHIMSCCSKL